METVAKLYKRDSQEFGDRLFQSCRNGNTAFIKEFMESSILKEYSSPSTVWQMLEDSGLNKHLEIIKYVLQSEYLMGIVEKEVPFQKCFQTACRVGDLPTIKYLIEDLKIDLTFLYIATGCYELIKNNEIESLKYILNQPQSEDFLKIEIRFPNLIRNACEHGHMEILQYLMSFPKLQVNNESYLFINPTEILKSAIVYEQAEVVKFLIFNLNLEKNNEIIDYLKKNPNQEINNLFALKELNKTLNSELKIEQNNKKRIKL